MEESANDVEKCLSSAQAGSQEALGEALDACRGYLLMIANEELDPALQAKGGASDLVQETLMEALRDFGRFRGDSTEELRQWLRRLLLNNLTDFTRKYRDTGKRRLDREEGLESEKSSTEGAGPAGDTTSPSGQALAREQIAEIQNILQDLPEDYRRVIILRYQEERSFEDIGRILNLTPNAARKLLVRAVEKVRQELDESS